MSAWTCRQSDGKADQKIVPPRLRTPCWKGLSAESEEKREPASDINTATLDSLKALDPNRPIREADIVQQSGNVRFVLRVQLVTATLLVVYRQGFRSPRSSAGVD
jgi:hypothetical protein